MNPHARRIVVGYDGSASAGTALDWATGQAERYDLPLTVISVVDYVGMLPGVNGPPSWLAVLQKEADEIASKGEQRARKHADSIDISTEACVGQVAGLLISASRSADRLVVGTRGHGGLAGTLLGSVGLALSAHAHCPVVVVRGDPTSPGPDRPVLVGIDDSAGARSALHYAADRAAEAHARLIVATTYRPVPAQVWAESGYYLDLAGSAKFDKLARESASNVTAAGVRSAKERHPDLDAQELVTTGSPAQELVRAAADGCGLLVVGTRGHGGFAGLLLGSVSHGVIHSAPCPVAILPTENRTPETSTSAG